MSHIHYTIDTVCTSLIFITYWVCCLQAVSSHGVMLLACVWVVGQNVHEDIVFTKKRKALHHWAVWCFQGWFPPSKSSSEIKENLKQLKLSPTHSLDARRFAWHFVDVMESCLGTNRLEQSASDILKQGFLYWEHGHDYPNPAMSKEGLN